MAREWGDQMHDIFKTQALFWMMDLQALST